MVAVMFLTVSVILQFLWIKIDCDNKIPSFKIGCASDQEISKFASKTDQIIDYFLQGDGRGEAWKRLAVLTDTFGHRMVGSKALDLSIDFLIDELNKEGFDNVHKEQVQDLPLWVRGVERAVLQTPVHRDIEILGLGGTVPTPGNGICASAVVVQSFDQLLSLGEAAVRGKIVVYNQPWTRYDETVQYRSKGASAAAKLGAVAALICSVTSKSYYTPHTGTLWYDPEAPKIPAACLTVEDAGMLNRMQEREEAINICLNITSDTKGTVLSYNTVAEIKGSLYPNEIVMISGHLDSWDVGTGAMDDGGGVVISWQALSALKALGLRPKRTVRAVFWTAEEQGYLGNTYYYKKHKNWANETFRFVYESDSGAFKPDGLCFNGSKSSTCTIQKILNLLSSINATKLYPAPFAGDVDPWRQDGVPAAILLTPKLQNFYFTYHHTKADNVLLFEPGDLDYSAAFTAVLAFVTADLENPL